MPVRLHEGDLPDDFDPGESIAVDCEAMGLRPGRDRLCLVQVSRGDGLADLVRANPGLGKAPNLVNALANPSVLKIFHYARFDIAALYSTYGVVAEPVYCTKIASVFARTFAQHHSLKDLCRDLLNVRLSKQEQRTDWGAEVLTSEQLKYAAADVLHLHEIKSRLDDMLQREGRLEYAASCFEFLPWRAKIDLAGWNEIDVFAHKPTPEE